MLSSVFFVNTQGRYEIHITAKPEKGVCMTTKELAGILSACTNRRMCPAQDERPVLSQEYSTIVCVEGRYFIQCRGSQKSEKGADKSPGTAF